MYYVTSTSDFHLGGLPQPGFPIVLWDDMRSCEPANRFLRYYLRRGAIGSERSWSTIGQAIYDFFGMLEGNGIAWDDIDRGEQGDIVSAYRDYCLKVANHRRSTVRLRLIYVTAFYKHAVRQGWISKLPFEYERRLSTVPATGMLAHLDASGGATTVASPMPKVPKSLFKYLSVAQVNALIAAVRNQHHRMIILLALRSGLRRDELATFPVAYITDPHRLGTTTRNVKITLDPEDGTGMKTKGGVPRSIWISRTLMEDLRHYVQHRRGERSSLTAEKYPTLFLNQNGEP